MKRIGLALVVLMLALSACVPAATPTPERIVETRVVERTVEKTVEVTKVIPTLTVIGPWGGRRWTSSSRSSRLRRRSWA